MAIDRKSQTNLYPEDTELVHAVISGDRAAYGMLYDRYIRLIEAICFDCTGDATQAQDISQDVFLVAFQRLGDLSKPQYFGRWTVGIARRACRDWRRAHRRTKARIERFADLRPPVSQSPDECASKKESLTRLHQAILRLPRKERLALQSFYLLDEPARRTQAILGLSQSGLYRLLERARARLKQWLQEDGRPSHG